MKRTSRPDSQRADDQDHALTYWSEKLRISRDELRIAVLTAGSIGKAVQRRRAELAAAAGRLPASWLKDRRGRNRTGR